MKYWLSVCLALASFLPVMSACDSKPQQNNGEMFLETAAKNSEKAKEAEAKVNEAAQKVNADLDAAMKQAK